ncbi:MAG TPA: glycoside hydrolase family 9 protein, partial [Cytophagales bacterium]|nr:glycoside hydrolase family 9 protein [Cytophagales bacterium]
GAGDQETDSLGRFTAKMSAALYLYDLTGHTPYLSTFENGINTFPLIAWGNYMSQYFQESQDLLFYYLDLPGINASKATQIKTATLAAAKKSGDFIAALTSETDPYRAFIKDYNWGSNSYKGLYGNFLWQVQNHSIEPSKDSFYLKAAEEYLHYVHGVNPFGLVYLTNMKKHGAENNIKEIYHSWFTSGSSKWDREGTSTYGPAPGFLAGGPNSGYTIDACCPSGCGSAQNNALCTSESTSPPLGQPAMTAYKDFNTSWPLNSWAVTENSNGYQTNYIRLLSKYVHNGLLTHVADEDVKNTAMLISPNPAEDYLFLTIPSHETDHITVELFDMSGNKVLERESTGRTSLSLKELNNGVYVLKVHHQNQVYSDKIIKVK